MPPPLWCLQADVQEDFCLRLADSVKTKARHEMATREALPAVSPPCLLPAVPPPSSPAPSDGPTAGRRWAVC